MEIQFWTLNENDKQVYPAAQALPGWFKRLRQEVPEGMTAKACGPLADAFSMGYQIGTYCDIVVRVRDFGGVTFLWDIDENEQPPVSKHARGQAPELPQVFKWNVKTGVSIPEGYSALWVHPLSRVELPFHSMSGVIDDGYTSPVHVPFVWTGPAGNYEISKGTPIVQVIPFKREEWVATHHSVNKDKLMSATNELNGQRHGYRRLFRKVKTYK